MSEDNESSIFRSLDSDPNKDGELVTSKKTNETVLFRGNFLPEENFPEKALFLSLKEKAIFYNDGSYETPKWIKMI